MANSQGNFPWQVPELIRYYSKDFAPKLSYLIKSDVNLEGKTQQDGNTSAKQATKMATVDWFLFLFCSKIVLRKHTLFQTNLSSFVVLKGQV